ncbi:hypothetical protein GCM10020219_102670 [Nonomuraea dietziae]
MLDPRKLKLLRELSRRGTIAAVAEALTFTASAVSQQLSALEREAGLPLLERTGRTVVLTPAGRLLVEHAEAVLASLERAEAALAATRTGPSGPLRIGAFPTAARALLPEALTILGEEHPGLEPMVAEIDPADVSAALRAGTLDVALVHEYDFVPPVVDDSVETRPLLTEPMYLTTRSALEEGRARPVDRQHPRHALPHHDPAGLPGRGVRAARPSPHRRLRHRPAAGRRRPGRGAGAEARRRPPALRRAADTGEDRAPHPHRLQARVRRAPRAEPVHSRSQEIHSTRDAGWRTWMSC